MNASKFRLRGDKKPQHIFFFADIPDKLHKCVFVSSEQLQFSKIEVDLTQYPGVSGINGEIQRRLEPPRGAELLQETHALLWADPAHVVRCVLSVHLVRACGCCCACWLNTTLIRFTGRPDGLQHTHRHNTQTRGFHMLAMWGMDVRSLIDIQIRHIYSDIQKVVVRQRAVWGGHWACEPLIASSQIWYRCNQISDNAAESISGFGRSSVTFVAEQWHGALVLNAITALASWTLRVVKNTDPDWTWLTNM